MNRRRSRSHRRPTARRRGPHRRGLPHRDLVALAELRGRVAVQLQGHRQRRLRVRAQGAVARGRRRGLGDAAHPDRVVVSAAEESRAGRRAQRRGVEAVVAQTAGRQPVRGRRPARPPEGARRAEAHVVEQDDQHVRRTGRREQRLDRSKGRVGVLRVVGRQARDRPVGNRQHRPRMPVRSHDDPSSSGLVPSSSRPGGGPVEIPPVTVACSSAGGHHASRMNRSGPTPSRRMTTGATLPGCAGG